MRPTPRTQCQKTRETPSSAASKCSAGLAGCLETRTLSWCCQEDAFPMLVMQLVMGR